MNMYRDPCNSKYVGGLDLFECAPTLAHRTKNSLTKSIIHKLCFHVACLWTHNA